MLAAFHRFPSILSFLTYARLTALLQDYLGEPVPERWNQSGFYWSKRQWVALASAGPCKSAPHSRQITTPAPHHSVFTGRMPFLPPNQQCQSTERQFILFFPYPHKFSKEVWGSIVSFAQWPAKNGWLIDGKKAVNSVIEIIELT